MKQKCYKREVYEQLYANILDNPKEMDEFLETCNLPRLTREERINLKKCNYI